MNHDYSDESPGLKNNNNDNVNLNIDNLSCSFLKQLHKIVVKVICIHLQIHNKTNYIHVNLSKRTPFRSYNLKM